MACWGEGGCMQKKHYGLVGHHLLLCHRQCMIHSVFSVAQPFRYLGFRISDNFRSDKNVVCSVLKLFTIREKIITDRNNYSEELFGDR